MYTITYIQGSELTSISSPSRRTAIRTYYNLRIKAKLNARLWKTNRANQPELIF